LVRDAKAEFDGEVQLAQDYQVVNI